MREAAIRYSGLVATTSDFTSRAFYAGLGWDMDNVWSIKEGVELPKLRAMPEVTAIVTPKATSVDISVYVQGNEIVISGVEQPQVTVFDINGRTIATGRTNSVTVKQTGVYIVRVNGKTVKVLVN